MDLGLRGKKAIVTGGARGLGAGICRSLAREGVDVAVNYAHPGSDERAAAVVEDLRAECGVNALSCRADVSREEGVAALFDAAETGFGGPVDILVNNAGICPVINIVDTSYETGREVMDINVDAVFLTCRELARRNIPRNHGGRIINIASQAAYNGSKNGKTHYSASKGAVVSFGVSFAKEVAKYGIYVNTVLPGMLLTELTRITLTDEEAVKKYTSALTLGRLGEISEVGDMVVFLASGLASYSTGAVFDITGGMMSR
jgi:NAD(P)-dependent dehydrogenase (short-subunit alcohol dehydrogenase family)